MILTVTNLSKYIRSRKVINNISLEVEPGQLYGILGPIGSGKTTFLSMILGATVPSSGSYQWFDAATNSSHRRNIGSILGKTIFCPWLSATANLAMVASIRRVPKPKNAINAALDLVNFPKNSTHAFAKYSLSKQKKLALAACILGNPEVLVLDAPTDGIDDNGSEEIREIILKMSHMGKTIILASHSLNEIENICSHVAILNHGKILQYGTVKSVLVQENIVEVAADDKTGLINALNDNPFQSTYEQDGNMFHVLLPEGIKSSEINTYLVGKSIGVSHLVFKEKSKEAHYLELLGKDL